MIMKKMALYSIFILSILLSSCSSGLKSRSVDQYYTTMGVEKYFLSDIPEWANFSQSAECFRAKGIRYFDLSALMKSFSLNYAEAIQVQATFNEEYLNIKSRPNVTLTLKDEEILFFKSNESVKSKITFFEAPTFKQIHLIWLDEALKGPKEDGRLRDFLQSSVHNNGFPVLVSACLTKAEIEAKFPDVAVKAISAEMFSIYDKEGVRKPILHINLNSFFKDEQKIIFYTQEKKAAEDIKGSYKSINY